MKLLSMCLMTTNLIPTQKEFNLKEGDIVVVLGKLDNRIIERKRDQLVLGTLYSFLMDDDVCVIIGDNELWIGPKRDIAHAREQGC